jgi:hypothetical protein
MCVRKSQTALPGDAGAQDMKKRATPSDPTTPRGMCSIGGPPRSNRPGWLCYRILAPAVRPTAANRFCEWPPHLPSGECHRPTSCRWTGQPRHAQPWPTARFRRSWEIIALCALGPSAVTRQKRASDPGTSPFSGVAAPRPSGFAPIRSDSGECAVQNQPRVADSLLRTAYKALTFGTFWVAVSKNSTQESLLIAGNY